MQRPTPGGSGRFPWPVMNMEPPGVGCYRSEARLAGLWVRSNYGAERQQSDIQGAERVVRAELGRLGWAEQDLRPHGKWDERKVSIARSLRQAATMSLKWIAQRLHTGSWTYVPNLPYGTPAARPPAQQQFPLCQ